MWKHQQGKWVPQGPIFLALLWLGGSVNLGWPLLTLESQPGLASLPLGRTQMPWSPMLRGIWVLPRGREARPGWALQAR